MNKDELIVRNLPLIPYTIKRMGLECFEYDLTDICYLAMVKFAHRYDPSISKESTFFYIVIKSAILCQMSYRHRQMRDMDVVTVPMDSLIKGYEDIYIYEIIPDSKSIDDELNYKELYNLFVKCAYDWSYGSPHVKGDKKKMNFDIYMSMLDGYTSVSMARKYGVSAQCVKEKRKIFKKRFKKVLTNMNLYDNI